MKIFYLKFHFSYPFRALRALTVCVIRLTINAGLESLLSVAVVVVRFLSSLENE